MKLDKTLADRVKDLLIEYPDLRDDFDYTLAMIWRQECNHTESNYSILGMIARREVSVAESVRRCWQLIQSECPDLRGKNWKMRQKHAKEDFPKEIQETKRHVSDQQSLL